MKKRFAQRAFAIRNCAMPEVSTEPTPTRDDPPPRCAMQGVPSGHDGFMCSCDRHSVMMLVDEEEWMEISEYNLPQHPVKEKGRGFWQGKLRSFIFERRSLDPVCIVRSWPALCTAGQRDRRAGEL